MCLASVKESGKRHNQVLMESMKPRALLYSDIVGVVKHKTVLFHKVMEGRKVYSRVKEVFVAVVVCER